MRPFIFKTLLFLLLQAGIFSLLLKNYDVSSETNFFARIVEKHQRLESTPPPRIILVGGSNVPFGFESDVMERALGASVVNMGLAAGVGVEFMLADIQTALRPGDLVLLSLEYDHFSRGTGRGGGFDPAVLQQILIFRPAGFLALRPIHFRKIVFDRGLLLLGEIARRAVGAQKEPALSPGERSPRAAFNEWGDLVGHRREPSRVSIATVEASPIVVEQPDFPNRTLLRHLREFVQVNAKHGVRVAFTFPPKPAAALRRDATRAEKVANALRGIPGLVLLDQPQDQAYPSDQFFDSANHLTAKGGEERTAKVTASLKRLLSHPVGSR